MKLRTTFLAGAALIATAVLSVQAQVPGVNSTLQAVFNLVYDNSTMKPTFSASSALILASAATDACMIQGSATKNIRLRRIFVSGVANAVVAEPVAIIKRSSAPVGGASTLMTDVPYDSVNSLSGASNAGTAVVDIYTTNPSVLGATVGTLADRLLGFGNLTTGLGAALEFNFGALGSPVVLRGIGQFVAVNFGGVTNANAQVNCTFEWTEE